MKRLVVALVVVGLVVTTGAIRDRTPVDAQATPGADLVVSHFESIESIAAGGLQTYTLSVTNNGPEAAAGFTAFLQLRSDVGSIVTTSPCARTLAKTVRCADTASLAVGAKRTFTVQARPGAARGAMGLVDSVAHVTSATYDPVTFNNVDEELTQVVASADIRTDLTGETSPLVNEVVTYTATVFNDGPDAAPAVTLTFSAPGAIHQATGATCEGVPMTCTIGGLGSRASRAVTFTVSFPTGGRKEVVARSADASYFDPNLTNNQDKVPVNVE